MHLAFGRADVGALAHKARRQAERQFPRQAQTFQIDRFAFVGVRKTAEISHELIARLGARLFQRRKHPLRLGEQRALGQHVRLADGAKLEPLFQ